MRVLPRSLVLSFVILTIVGCAADVGPDGRAVGGPCLDEFDCALGSFCLRNFEFPDGTCTMGCRDDDDCVGGTSCVEEAFGACLLSCTTDMDCGRDGYVCRERGQPGEGGSSRVCVGG